MTIHVFAMPDEDQEIAYEIIDRVKSIRYYTNKDGNVVGDFENVKICKACFRLNMGGCARSDCPTR